MTPSAPINSLLIDYCCERYRPKQGHFWRFQPVYELCKRPAYIRVKYRMLRPPGAVRHLALYIIYRMYRIQNSTTVYNTKDDIHLGGIYNSCRVQTWQSNKKKKSRFSLKRGKWVQMTSDTFMITPPRVLCSLVPKPILLVVHAPLKGGCCG